MNEQAEIDFTGEQLKKKGMEKISGSIPADFSITTSYYSQANVVNIRNS